MKSTNSESVQQNLAEKYLNAHYAIARVMAQSTSLSDSTQSILQTLCKTLDWQFGVLWIIDLHSQVFRCTATWNSLPVQLSEFENFLQNNFYSSDLKFFNNIFSIKKVILIQDLITDPVCSHFEGAIQGGLKSICAIPILDQKNIIGIIGLFSSGRIEFVLDKIFESIGIYIGQFLKRRRSEEMLSQLEAVIESSDDAIISQTLDGIIASWNFGAQKIYGYSANELIGHSARILFPLDNQNELIGILERIRRGEHLTHYETIHQKKDGTNINVAITISPIRNTSNRIIAITNISRDITEIKRIEAELKTSAKRLAQSNRELQDFAYVASHDLQEPLRKIQSFGDRLRAKCIDLLGKEELNYLDRMQNAATRMHSLIKDILTFSHISNNKASFVPVKLSQIAKEVLSDLEALIEKTNGKIEIGELPTIEADPRQIRQLFQNLIGNALKFRKKEESPIIKLTMQIITTKEKINISSTNLPSIDDGISNDEKQFLLSKKEANLEENFINEPLCKIIIEDNGIGFDEKYLDRIFVVFQRLHGRGEYEGTGIGLAICKKIVMYHRGNISVTSSLGQGTKFIITLPMMQPK